MGDRGPLPTGFSCAGAGTDCSGSNKPSHWAGASETDLDAYSIDGGPREHRALGVNDDGNIVGTGFVDADLSGALVCRQAALYWDDDTATVLSLPVPTGTPYEDQAQANAIRNLVAGEVFAVGRNINTNEAYLWIRTGTSWQYHNLNSLLINGCGWALLEATAISDKGWIVGRGLHNGVERAFLLVPLPTLCDGDLNGDCKVNGIDLAMLLATWGTCALPTCRADINCSGAVDGGDLATLLASWSGANLCNTECLPLECSTGDGEGESMMSGSEEGQPSFIAVLVQILHDLGEHDAADWLEQHAGTD